MTWLLGAAAGVVIFLWIMLTILVLDKVAELSKRVDDLERMLDGEGEEPPEYILGKKIIFHTPDGKIVAPTMEEFLDKMIRQQEELRDILGPSKHPQELTEEDLKKMFDAQDEEEEEGDDDL